VRTKAKMILQKKANKNRISIPLFFRKIARYDHEIDDACQQGR